MSIPFLAMATFCHSCIKHTSVIQIYILYVGPIWSTASILIGTHNNASYAMDISFNIRIFSLLVKPT